MLGGSGIEVTEGGQTLKIKNRPSRHVNPILRYWYGVKL